MEVLNIIILACIGEALWETLKLTWQKGKVSEDRIGAIVVGVIIALSTGVDIMHALSIPMRVPYLGTIFTGLLISRGANFTHDLISTLNNHMNSRKN